MEISTSFTFFKHGKILIAKLQREKDMFLVTNTKKTKIANTNREKQPQIGQEKMQIGKY